MIHITNKNEQICCELILILYYLFFNKKEQINYELTVKYMVFLVKCELNVIQ